MDDLRWNEKRRQQKNEAKKDVLSWKKKKKKLTKGKSQKERKEKGRRGTNVGEVSLFSGSATVAIGRQGFGLTYEGRNENKPFSLFFQTPFRRECYVPFFFFPKREHRKKRGKEEQRKKLPLGIRSLF